MATTVNSPDPETSLFAAADSIAVPAEPSAWIKLLPAGSFTCRDGRGPFHAGDVAALEAVLAQTKQHLAATDMMVDYDHQSILSAVEGVGGTAKAAGWIKAFEIRDDGIYGQVDWTDAASAAIKAREYRYISPLFTVEKSSGRVMALRNAALVNMPALDLEAIAARFTPSHLPHSKDFPMDQIALALGLEAQASEADILAAIAKQTSNLEALALAAGFSKDSSFEAIAAAIKTAQESSAPDPAKYVPIDQVAAMQADLATLKSSLAEDKAEDLVTAAIADGKLSPALKDWGLELCKTDPARFEAFAASAPQLTSAQLGDKKREEASEARDPVELAAAASAHQAKLAENGQVIDIAAAVSAIQEQSS
ncbi:MULTISPECIES: phage protease [unclassified Roseibium]|uniref:phage protease n=1 Tax=unclassified Roseibium TaxID=2629323 RepID=UPI00273F1734|nr:MULTISPECIES: phage protease [unclassified Roseibium]